VGGVLQSRRDAVLGWLRQRGNAVGRGVARGVGRWPRLCKRILPERFSSTLRRRPRHEQGDGALTLRVRAPLSCAHARHLALIRRALLKAKLRRNEAPCAFPPTARRNVTATAIHSVRSATTASVPTTHREVWTARWRTRLLAQAPPGCPTRAPGKRGP
jgi:hypothetical protein